jgi:hypothetical protein
MAETNRVIGKTQYKYEIVLKVALKAKSKPQPDPIYIYKCILHIMFYILITKYFTRHFDQLRTVFNLNFFELSPLVQYRD